jgi:hypothetical protein
LHSVDAGSRILASVHSDGTNFGSVAGGDSRPAATYILANINTSITLT